MLTDGTIVVLGAGQAGGWAAATLRKEGFAGRVVLVGAEIHRPYERPPLSKAVLKGEATAESCAIHPLEAFEAQALEFRSGVRADRLELSTRTVHLDSGESLPYDRLIVTTGGRARPLPIPGGDLPGVLVLRTVEDSAALGQRMRTGQPIVIVGGGWIGLEAASVAAEYGCAVTVVEMADRLCARTVPPVISDYLLRLHRSHGVDVHLGTGVSRIDLGEGGLTVTLADGSALSAGSVVAGVGLIPNDELAMLAGLTCHHGIVVDSRCQTSDPFVYAAGDVTLSPNPYSPTPMRLESWQNAQEQGVAAARSALGLDVAHDILPWFWSDQYSVRLQIYGIPEEHHVMAVRGDPQSDNFTVMYLEDDVVVAAMGPGNTRDIRICKRLIERRIPIVLDALVDTATPLPKK